MTYKAQKSTAILCSATITRKKNRIKSYGDASSAITPLKYFLKNGEEFEIELFNPHQTQVLAKIKINGVPLSSSGIVLMPGQRVFLERFIDTNEKFLFKTYEVGGSDEVKNAIAKNGDISVEFYHERIKINNPYIQPYTYPNYWGNPGLNTIGGTGNFGSLYGSTINSPFNSPIGSTLTDGITSFNLNNISFSTSTFSTNINDTVNCFYSNTGTLSLNEEQTRSKKSLNADKTETGRVSGGAESSQTFETVYGDFNTYATQTIWMKMLPESQKPVEVSEIRNYCPGCRNRIKKTSWKFCPSCGETL